MSFCEVTEPAVEMYLVSFLNTEINFEFNSLENKELKKVLIMVSSTK